MPYVFVVSRLKGWMVQCFNCRRHVHATTCTVIFGLGRARYYCQDCKQAHAPRRTPWRITKRPVK